MWNGFEGDGGNVVVHFLVMPFSTFMVMYLLSIEGSIYSFLSPQKERLMSILSLSGLIRGVLFWIFTLAFALILYRLVPGRNVLGPTAISGKRYLYKVNALYSIGIRMVLYHSLFVGPEMGFLREEVIYSSIGISYLISWVIYYQGKHNPRIDFHENSPRDSCVDNFYLGIELTPRLSSESTLDLKLFMVGHIGMFMWAFVNHINLMHAVYHGTQAQKVITGVVYVLQLVYIVDWGVYEDWYLDTIDMKHDRMGYYLCFGSITWMPIIYTSYTFYTSRYLPWKDIPSWIIAPIVGYLVTYMFFRLANNEKFFFRLYGKAEGKNGSGENIEEGYDKKDVDGGENEGRCDKGYIRVQYMTSEGIKSNYLLTSGTWGILRHFNYTMDILMCCFMSVICGFEGFMAHMYTVYLTVVLITRNIRDEKKCFLKYGQGWEEYKKIVRYSIVPYVY